MKTFVLASMFLLITLCTASFGQSVLSSVPQVPRIADHPMHAEAQAMASERSLVGGGPTTYSYARGERPLWEFGPVSDCRPTPLGDVARAVRKEKQAAKKAEIVFEKQGS